MNFLSWLIIALIASWLAFAIVRMLKRKGTCSCGGCSGACNSKQCCACKGQSCAQCKQQKH